jgi:hypothetical protein
VIVCFYRAKIGGISGETAMLLLPSRYCPGDVPSSRLNAFDREALVLYPVRRAMAAKRAATLRFAGNLGWQGRCR